MRSEGYGTWSVCLCVCVPVYDYSGTTGNEAASERYKQLQCNKRSKSKQAILLKRRCLTQPIKKRCEHACASPRPLFFPVPTRPRVPLPLLTSFTLPSPLAAQRNGEKRMCSPVYLLMLPVCEKLALLTGIHRVGPCSIE